MKGNLKPAFWLALFFVSITQILSGQTSQVVRGKVISSGGSSIPGASVELKSDSTYTFSSGENGEFQFEVPASRYILIVSANGFSTFEDELLVVSGKSVSLSVILKASTVQLNDIIVNSNQVSQELPGSNTLSIEKTMRVPANFFDPVRLTISLPGVVPTNDQSNSISIKGYTPNALMWRLMGLDIVNPNHLANAGTLSDKPVANGGGVSILSSQVLDQTKFYSGALPVQYGNALSGAFDMSLRPGSKISREHTLQASLLGIDLATEGPFGKTDKTANGSYLVNYRYSTVGLLSQLGVNFGDEKINFQDLTFNLDFDHKKSGHLSIFGFGGLSKNQFDRKPQEDWETEKDRYNIDFTGNVYGIGFINTSNAGKNGELKFGISASGQFQERASESEPVPVPHISSEYSKGNRTLISTTLSYSKEQSNNFSWMMGWVATSFQQELKSETVLSDPIIIPPTPNGNVDGILFQPYINSNIKFGLWKIIPGIRYAYFNYNSSQSIEPRISVVKSFRNGQLNFNYGITSQMQQASTYLLGGKSLGLNKAHQYAIGYLNTWQNVWLLRTQLYYHQLFNIANASATVPYSALNQIEDWTAGFLNSNGRGRSYGIEASLEKRFENKMYFMASGSWYQSEFSDKSGSYYPTRFNGNFTSSLNGGREWSKKNKTFGIHTRVLYLGGLRQSAIDAGESPLYGFTVYDNANEFPVKNSNYFRIDLRASWRKNKPGYTRTWSIDIQNLTNQQNVAYQYYDTFTRKIETKYQLGLIPVIVYRIDF